MANPQNIDRPTLACEISADRVTAARASKSGLSLESHSVRRLGSGALMPGLGSPNVQQAAALRHTIEDALTSVGAAGRSRDIIAILPDAAVRVLLLDFESLPDKPAEAAPIIRFRVKKSLPFDSETAALSYEARRNGTGVKVVAAMSPKEVLEEYEAIFREAGYQPGVVLPSILATLGLVSADRPTMLVKLDATTTTVSIVDRDELLLLRTIEHPVNHVVTAQELSDTVHPSMAFFEDTYGSKIEHVMLTGTSIGGDLAGDLHRETGVTTEELEPVTGGNEESTAALAAVAGALLG